MMVLQLSATAACVLWWAVLIAFSRRFASYTSAAHLSPAKIWILVVRGGLPSWGVVAATGCCRAGGGAGAGGGARCGGAGDGSSPRSPCVGSFADAMNARATSRRDMRANPSASPSASNVRRLRSYGPSPTRSAFRSLGARTTCGPNASTTSARNEMPARIAA